jgi:hypothetical protein
MKYFLILLVFMITSCGTFKEAGKILRNEKRVANDEFLMQKKDPLVLPPDFEIIPSPDSITEKKSSNNEKIKKILKAPRSENAKTKKSTSTEESILNKIRK